jgi:hypothetical protein
MGEVLLRHPLLHLYLLYVVALILAHLYAVFSDSKDQGGERQSVSNPRGSGPSLSGGRLGERAEDSVGSSAAIQRTRQEEDDPARKRTAP